MQEKKPIEILAPAGSWECLEPAVRCGCNAVYLGGAKFSARASAKNFDNDQLAAAVKYCHGHNVKTYLAINTLIREDEMPSAMELAEYASSVGVDALIIQDLGFASLVHRRIPQMRMHASTQMSIHTPAGAELLAELGFRRVTLSRELSLREIEKIAEKSPIELEAFIHGALCMSVSGQCYFSAVLGGRSGNRGLCAQTCRLPFCSPGGTGYDLSLKDLSGIQYIAELEKMGVASAKIEGRMKRPEYVAAAVSACRAAADGQEVPLELSEALRAVFSRSGFTQGYLEGKLGKDMFGIRSKEDVVSATEGIFGQLRNRYRNERNCIPIRICFTAAENQPSRLTVSSEDKKAEIIGLPAVQAEQHPLEKKRVREQLEKTGGTPFISAETEIHLGENIALPISELNRMRREGLEKLREKWEQVTPLPLEEIKLSTPHRENVERCKQYHLLLSPDQLQPQMKNTLSFLPLDTSLDFLREKLSEGYAVGVELPRGMFGREESIAQKCAQCMEIGITDFRVGNLGAVAICRSLMQKNTSLRMYGGFGLNVWNGYTVEVLKQLGLSEVELSFELTVEQAKKVGGSLPRGVMTYGRLPLMLTRNCPIKNGVKNCGLCDKKGAISDRKGVAFPVRCTGGCSQIFNSVPTYLLDRQKEFSDFDFQIFYFTVENSVEVVEILQQKENSKKPKNDFTRGLYYRGVE